MALRKYKCSRQRGASSHAPLSGASAQKLGNLIACIIAHTPAMSPLRASTTRNHMETVATLQTEVSAKSASLKV